MSNFLTVEDINTTLFNKPEFWWYVLDSRDIPRTDDYTELKFDFLRIEHTRIDENHHKYYIKIDNDLFTQALSRTNVSRSLWDGQTLIIDNYHNDDFKIYLYMGPKKFPSEEFMIYSLEDNVFDLTLKELKDEQAVNIIRFSNGVTITDYHLLRKGYNEIRHAIAGGDSFCGYLWVNLVKSDFQFNCEQSLTLGKVNTVCLGTLEDYLPGGGMIDDYTPSITVKYKNQILPVYFDETLNDYCFDIDLSNVYTIGTVDLEVSVETNAVLNSSTTKIRLNLEFETINNLAELTQLCHTGGVGVLGDGIVLSEDLVLLNNVFLKGDNILDLNNHKIIVRKDVTFNAENIRFENGVNAIKQNNGSKLELIGCSFSNCTSTTGLGSCICCDIDLDSLDNPNDFNTVLTDCNFTDNSSCILHGGELIIDDCTVNGIIANKNYPYFLYQTDGNANIIQSTFHLTNEDEIDYDIEFNSCIFVCGETATINGLNHTDLQNNNLTSFLQRNNSTIDVTYYYNLIEDYITLQSIKGYCHAVSGVDYVFKTHITPKRS
jgi:hypothetical protein